MVKFPASVITDLTDYIRCLGEGGAPPDHATYEAAREMLRSQLVREMMRRGLWSAPPSFLGLPGGSHWTSESIDELVSDCYEEIFLYDVLGASLGRLLDGGVLSVDPPGRVHNTSQCVFTGRNVPASDPAVDLGPVVRRWNAELWPELLQAQGRARRRVFSRLDELIAGLPREGVGAFRFKDLIDPMKSDPRGRWREELVAQAERMVSRNDPEDALRFRKLRDCVRRELEAAPAAERADLLRLWELLWSYAAGRSEERVAEKAEKSGRPPTDLPAARRL